jgi:hypothetical protein
MPTIRGLNDRILEKALIHQANEYQQAYVLKLINEDEFSALMPGKKKVEMSPDYKEALKGWGAGKEMADGSSSLGEDASLMDKLMEYRRAQNEPQRAQIKKDMRAILGVKTEMEKLKEKVEADAEKYNSNVNISNIVFEQ